MPLLVFQQLFDQRCQQYDGEWHDGSESTRWRHSRNLLNQGDEQKEKVGILRKLFKQKLWKQRQQVVLSRRYSVALKVL